LSPKSPSDNAYDNILQTSAGLIFQWPRRFPRESRFTHVYTDRGEPVGDSRRMRVRMEALLFSIDRLFQSGVMARELGVEFGTWWDFFREAPMQDILDLVTVGYDYLLDGSYHSSYHADRWRDGVQRIFSEENIHYRVDGQGGVHFNLTENSRTPLPRRSPFCNQRGMQTH
jgi:hypothetical protein